MTSPNAPRDGGADTGKRRPGPGGGTGGILTPTLSPRMQPSRRAGVDQPPDPSARNAGNFGWFRAMRNPEALELIKRSKNAFLLAYIIASRSRWTDTFNADNLRLGEAFLGDHENYGMSEQEYRTAKTQLEKSGFATFEGTSKGTVAKLTDARLFSISRPEHNDQNNGRVTDGQRSANDQPTTNKKDKKEEEPKEGGESQPPMIDPQSDSGKRLTASERISAEKQIERIDKRLKEIEDSASCDAFGPKYKQPEKDERRELSERRKKLLRLVEISLP